VGAANRAQSGPAGRTIACCCKSATPLPGIVADGRTYTSDRAYSFGVVRITARFAFVAVVLAALLASNADAQTWSDFATISSTMGINGGYLCLGESTRGDIGCPTYAPSVSGAGQLTAATTSTGGLTVTGNTSLAGVSATNVSATGNISALKFIGDGSLLSGISTQGDRITSGTASAIANTTGGFISLTTGLTTWGYIGSSATYLPLVSLTSAQVSNTVLFSGKSVTNVAGGSGNRIISGSANVTAYGAGSITFTTGGSQRAVIDSSGNLGIGTANPVYKLDVSGSIAARSSNYLLLFDSGNTAAAAVNSPATNQLGIQTGGSERVRIDASGNVGIGTTSPQNRLQVGAGTDAPNVGNSLYVTNAGSTYVSVRDSSNHVEEILGADSSAALIGSRTNHPIWFQQNGTNVGAWTSTGLIVGGTSGPGWRLDVNGGLLLRGAGAGTTCGYGTALCVNYSGAGTQYGAQFVPAADNTYPLLFFSAGGGGPVGSVYTTAAGATFNTSSDYRLKEHIVPLHNGLSRVMELKPSRFNFKSVPTQTVDGFLAHEVQKVIPEAVTGHKDEVDADGKPVYQSMDYGRITPLLTAAIQDLKAGNDNLRAQLKTNDANWKRELDEVRSELKELKAAR
jgi:hypothetical protein